jgi:hypothetical protein
MLARYHSPGLGRFLSVDPVGDRPTDPPSWNAYAYVRNNPISLIDPSGMSEEDAEQQKPNDSDDQEAEDQDRNIRNMFDHFGFVTSAAEFVRGGAAEFYRLYPINMQDPFAGLGEGSVLDEEFERTLGRAIGIADTILDITNWATSDDVTGANQTRTHDIEILKTGGDPRAQAELVEMVKKGGGVLEDPRPGGARVGQMPDGSKIVYYPRSRDRGCPTVEIQPKGGGRRVKFRYEQGTGSQ